MVSAFAWVALLAANREDVARNEVFPIERLPAEMRGEAETLLLKAMDREALFTIVGGMKPMSSGWLSLRERVDKPDVPQMTRLRRILACFTVGDDVRAYLQPFWRVYGEDRYLDGVFFSRSAVDATLERHRALFGWFGVSAGSHPLEAVMAIDRDDTPRRNRAYGYLFGYPDHAVEFFTRSEEDYRKTRKIVPRDFRSIPTFSMAEHAFVYAVPKGDSVRPEDVALRDRAAPILAMYRQLRPRYIGSGKPGIVALLRDWMDDGKGRCSPQTAERKARQASGGDL